jgi:hypothetical protein
VLCSSKDVSLLNLLLKSMKVSFSIMIQTLTHIVFSIRTLVVLKSYVMRCLMRLMALKRCKLILILKMMKKLHVMPYKE